MRSEWEILAKINKEGQTFGNRAEMATSALEYEQKEHLKNK